MSAASASLAANGFALTSSPKPPARPASLKMAVSKTNSKGAVDKAVDVAINQPVADPAPAKQPAQQAVQVASNTVADGQDEPDIETNAPTMPTNASVAKQATTRHALSSSKVALLAVFGSPSTRFAMVRQANGAVKKVQVGDNVDGGRIGAITDNSVQYSKGGQVLTLSLPTG
jgi:type IV pilus biogenesis protein PilP